jgi:hypothetical protein
VGAIKVSQPASELGLVAGILQIDARKLQPAAEEVKMTIEEARDNPSSPRVDDTRLWPGETEHLCRVPQGENPIPPNGDGLCIGSAAVYRPNMGVCEDQVCCHGGRLRWRV